MKKILVLNFFPAFVPPKSGGELRYYYMYLGLSKFYDVTLLSPTYNDAKEEVITHSKTFREYRIPKEDIHNRLHAEIDREKICSEISALVCCLSANTHNRYHDAYLRLYADADIIIHESPYMLYYDLFFGLDDKPRIYNSYNVETHLMEQMWKGPNADKYLSVIRKAEKTLVSQCDLVFAICEEERQRFIAEFGGTAEKIFLAPNGIDVKWYEDLRIDRRSNKHKKAMFIGSAHPPNLEAVDFLENTVAPRCPDIMFYIAGKCSENRTSDKGNVRYMGLIDEDQKAELFRTCDVAVNPMFSGAGTNLKTLEFLSAGIPMVSTDVGVRGLGLDEGVHYVNADKDSFAEELNKLVADQGKMDELAIEGKRFVNSNYSWPGICGNVYTAIEGLKLRNKKTKPLVLEINDYGIDNPMTGGELRIFNLLKNMASHFKIVYICLSESKVEKKELSDDLTSINIPKTDEHKRYEIEVNRQYWVSANDIIAGKMITKNKLFMDCVKQLYELADAVILEHPYLVDAIDGLAGKPLIYESQNFEYQLKLSMLQGHPMGHELIEAVRRMEYSAVRRSNQVVCCSADEVRPLKAFGEDPAARFDVVRNGVKFTNKRYDYSVLRSVFGEKKIAVFVGSPHVPNVDAAGFIIRELANQLPEIAFVIIGGVCDAFQGENIPENVVLLGKVEDKYKEFMLFASDIALNPVDQGAGSNLKLAEYFAYSIPVVTTPFGARGYEIEDGKHAVICQRASFADGIRRIIGDSKLRDCLITNAYSFARSNLDWTVLAEKCSSIIYRLLNKHRLLIITYRYNMPPRGGAEVYLNKVLTEIEKTGRYLVEVATTDVGDIKDVFRFSCDYTIDRDMSPENSSTIHIRKFPVIEISQEEKWKKSNKLYIQEMKESVELGRRFAALYSKPVLMGGWHCPEVDKNGTRIWSSGLAEINVKEADRIRLQGNSPRRKEVRCRLDNRTVKRQAVSGAFDLDIDVQNGEVLTIETESFSVPKQDPRPLGLYFHKIRYCSDGVWYEIDLTLDYKQFVREKDSNLLVDGLIELANHRDSEFEKMFYEIRGPRSNELEGWLEENIESYDVVIGQSVPFDTLVFGQQIAKRHGVSFLALPHYHMEDSYYHWKMYYEALKQADCVIAAPNISKEMFFDKIGAKAETLPGGGIDPSEFEHPNKSLFLSKYNFGRPFVLVLGRKAGGKNYNWVIDAIEEVNRRGTSVQLVMIGRDYDKVPVSSPNLTYLGEQSREMVLSALSNCAFVVNMSESESFGIVILEAWLSGKTVVVNRRCAAFTELVDDGVNGVLAAHEELADKIDRLLHNKSIDEMALHGKRKAENYTWEHVAGEILQLCDEAANRKSKGKMYGKED